MTKRLAIVERLPGHTEVMGGFAALAIKLGYDTHLLFNGKDQFHLVEYLRTRLPVASENIHDWSYINDPGSNFDVILLNTSYVWLDYGRQLQQWNAHNRLIVVHHHPEDIELNPHGARVYLTPAVGKEKWIFPLYSEPSSQAGSGPEDLPSARDSAELPTLVTIGALDLKNVADVLAHMNAGGNIMHYDRHKCRHFEEHSGTYAQHVGLNGVDFMASLAQQKQRMFLWFPILPDSNYMECRFCGALILGVEMNCVMVMPERLRKLYEFPEDAVITYDSSVTEAECMEKLRASAMIQEERRRQLRMWAVKRWQKNMDVFRSLLGNAPS